MAEKIELEAVDSSSIAALGYNPDKRILAVRFKSGDIWHYAGITPEMAGEFYAALSKGQFYAMHIRGKFQAEKMTGACPDCGDRGWIGDGCADCGCSTYQPDPRKEKKGAGDATGSDFP